MKTFTEDFEFFKKNLSYEKLFLNGYISEKKEKIIEIILKIYVCITAIVLFLLIKFWIDMIILIFIFPVIFLFYLCYDNNKKRKYLKKEGLPVAKEFYRWKCKKLEIMRIEEIYKKYNQIDNSRIIKLIEIANVQLKNNFNDSFTVFEKVGSYFGSNFFNFILGFVMALSIYDLKNNPEIYLKNITGIFFLFSIFVSSYYFNKYIFLFDQNSNKKQLQDYIFVLENILLMKQNK